MKTTYLDNEIILLEGYKKKGTISHYQNRKLAEYKQIKQLLLHNVVKSLPIRKYEIDFGGDVKCGLEITKDELIVIGAMNGWGNGISKEDIIITTL